MPVLVGSFFLRVVARSWLPGRRRMQTQGAGLRGWLGAGCALVLMCACASPRCVVAQASDSTATPAAGTHPTSSRTSSRTAANRTSNGTAAAHKRNVKRSSSHKSGSRKTSARGQQKIDPQRAQEIQEALIREHYLSGDAAGTWNQSSEEAMRRYQADHGWQAKTVPDARALISLGLGPSHDHLLNPESAMTTEPVAHNASLTPMPHGGDMGARTNTTSPVPPAAASTPATAPEHDTSRQ